MKKIIYYVVQVLYLLAICCSCKKDNIAAIAPGSKPKAAFTIEKLTGYAPMRIRLLNTSQYADSYYWTIAGSDNAATMHSPEFQINRKGTYSIKLVCAKGILEDSVTKEIVVENDPAMKALYLFSNNWADSSDYGNHISGGHGLLRADPDRKDQARSCINMGTLGGALFLPDDLLRNTGTATTISMWIKANTIIKNPLLGYWKADEPSVLTTPSIYFDETGKLRLKFANGTVAPQISVEGLAADTWHHIVLTGNGTVQKAYVNGVLQGTINSDPINHGLMNTAALGYMYVPGNSTWAGLPGATWSSYNFKGLFDDVRIYNKMLSEAEVMALFEE